MQDQEHLLGGVIVPQPIINILDKLGSVDSRLLRFNNKANTLTDEAVLSTISLCREGLESILTLITLEDFQTYCRFDKMDQIKSLIRSISGRLHNAFGSITKGRIDKVGQSRAHTLAYIARQLSTKASINIENIAGLEENLRTGLGVLSEIAEMYRI